MKKLEAFIKGLAQSSVCVGANSNNGYSCSQGRDGSNHTRAEHIMKLVKQIGAEWNRDHPKTGSHSSGNARRVVDLLTTWTDVYIIRKMLIQEATENLDVCVMNIVKQIVNDALDTCDEVHNKAFVKGALIIV